MGAFNHLKWTYEGAFKRVLSPTMVEFEQKFPKNSYARWDCRGMLKLPIE